MRTPAVPRTTRWRTPAAGSLVAAVTALAAFAAGAVVGQGPVPAPRTQQVLELEQVAGAASPTFRVASFNILGANHTDGRNPRKGYATSSVRTPRVAKVLNLNGVDVVGFQEMNRIQHTQFKKATGSTWGTYPGDQLSNYATHNTIAWRSAEWELVEANTIKITYFNGTLVPMPFILLRHLETGRLTWFANFHNPASTKNRPPQKEWRLKAKAAQIALANRIHESGVPLVLTGDMNERETYFCPMTTQAPMKSASGGSWGTAPCKPPADVRIDWVFGSNYLAFANYRAARGNLIQKTTDHPVILADVTVPGRPRA